MFVNGDDESEQDLAKEITLVDALPDKPCHDTVDDRGSPSQPGHEPAQKQPQRLTQTSNAKQRPFGLLRTDRQLFLLHRSCQYLRGVFGAVLCLRLGGNPESDGDVDRRMPGSMVIRLKICNERQHIRD